VVLTVCYLRIAALACAGSQAVTVAGPWGRAPCPGAAADLFVAFLALAQALDVLARWASRQSGLPMDSLATALATLGDRLGSLTMMGTLILLDQGTRHRSLFAFILALDLTSYCLQMAVATALGPPA
ncbi:unnamed protein product, partial [Discosporangium mesarthrocarpum]